MKFEHILSVLSELDSWGVNYQPWLKEFANFLVDVQGECGLIALEVRRDENAVYFRTKIPLTPSIAFRMGLLLFGGEPREIRDDQTEFTVWWD